MWHEVQVQAVVDDAMESDIPQERLPIDGVATEDIPLHPEPLHPEQPTTQKQIAVISKYSRGWWRSCLPLDKTQQTTKGVTTISIDLILRKLVVFITCFIVWTIDFRYCFGFVSLHFVLKRFDNNDGYIESYEPINELIWHIWLRIIYYVWALQQNS